MAEEHDIKYFETSAKENINVNEVMQFIMKAVYENLYSKDSNHGIEARESIVIGAKGDTSQGGSQHMEWSTD